MGDGVNKGVNLARVIIVMGSLVIVALVGVIVALVMVLTRGDKEPTREVQPEAQQRMTVVNENNVEEVIEDALTRELVRPGSYEVTQNTEWHFADGESASYDAYVENSTSNTSSVYFDVMLAGTEEKIYESPVIPVGNSLRNIRLMRDLDAGTYDCVMTYSLVDGNQNVQGTLNLVLTIIVEN